MDRGSKLGVLASAFLLACGGGGGGGAAKCNADAECTGAGVRCVDHVCQVALTVVINTPSATTTYASGVVHVEIEVVNGTATSLELLVNGIPVATLTAPFRMDWNTVGKAEGPYQFVARVAAGAQRYESEPRTVIVDHTPPLIRELNARGFTNQRPTPVSGKTDAGATVTISEAGQAIGSAVADSNGVWSTELDLSPGPAHALTARATDLAGNVTPDASAIAFSITVDQTPLAITSQTPKPGATNVWSRDPITVTFNKALAPAKVTASAASIRLARQDALNPGTSTTIPLATPQLSDENRTLTLRPTVVPQGPCTLTLTLPAALADGFGNALTETQWTWAVPEWQDLGTALTVQYFNPPTVPRIAITGDDRPVVAVYGCDGPCATWLVEWTGPSGGWATRLEEAKGWNASVDVDALGRPVMVWEGSNCINEGRCDMPSLKSNISHGRWDGTRFIVSATISSQNYATAPAIRVDALGNQVIAWAETVSGEQHLVGKVWNGDWMSLEPPGYSTGNVAAIDASLDAHGDVRFTWTRDRWLYGATWSAAAANWNTSLGMLLPTSLPAGALVSKVDAAAQNVYSLVPDTTTTPGQSLLKMHRLSCSTFSCSDTVLGAGSSGGVLNVNPSAGIAGVSLALDPDGSPVVAWVEGLTLYVKRWDPAAGSWRPLGAAADGSGLAVSLPSLAIGGDGVVAVAFTLGNNVLAHSTSAKRYNGSWTLTTPPPTPITSPIPPTVLTPPAGASVTVGSTATFTVVAYGPAPMTWQWRKGGVPIADATGASYTTPATTLGDDGAQYDVAIKGRTGGQVTAGPATLRVTQ